MSKLAEDGWKLVCGVPVVATKHQATTTWIFYTFEREIEPPLRAE